MITYDDSAILSHLCNVEWGIWDQILQDIISNPNIVIELMLYLYKKILIVEMQPFDVLPANRLDKHISKIANLD